MLTLLLIGIVNCFSDPKLDAHLERFEKLGQAINSYYAEIELTRTNILTQKTYSASGGVRHQKPGNVYYRIDSTARREDFHAVITDGREITSYWGTDKRAVRTTLAAFRGPAESHIEQWLDRILSRGAMDKLDVLQPALWTVKRLKTQWDVKLLKEDAHYIYLQFESKDVKYGHAYQNIIVVLYNDRVKGLEYLPAKIRAGRSGETEEWTFKNIMIDPVGITQTDFKFIEPPKNWRVVTLAEPKREVAPEPAAVVPPPAVVCCSPPQCVPHRGLLRRR